LGALGGRWTGQKLDGRSSETILTIAGLFLGLIVAFFGVYRMLKSILMDKNDEGK
jgi:succinate-acetate transporter protein